MTNVGFFGLPGSGKSTVFKALTRQAVEPQFLGFDLKPHQAVVKIPDARLDRLSEYYKTRSTVHATMEFVDIPGYDPAETEAKLKTAVLEHYRRSDALALVIDLFHPASAVQAAASMRKLLDELTIMSYITAETALARLEKQARLKDKDALPKFELVQRILKGLEDGVPVRRMELDAPERKLIREYAFLSEKPLIAVLNVADDAHALPGADIPGMEDALAVCAEEAIEPVRLSAALEAEIAGMDDAEAAEYMAEFGVTEPALPRFIRAAYSSLGLITFLTASEKECRSWSITRGMNAQQSAGVIHSDLARGFIRAETIHYDDLVQYPTEAAAKAAGKIRLEGKEYPVKDGDILHIRFNV
jgi:ribosome-binding ATPase